MNNLLPLPEPRFRFEISFTKTGERLDYTEAEMRAYGAACAEAERERCLRVIGEQAEALAENLYGHPREKAQEWAKEDKFDSEYNKAEDLLEIVAAAIRKG